MVQYVVILFVEGATEVVFYRKLIEYLIDKKKIAPDLKYEIKSLDGITHFEQRAIRIFKNAIQPKYPDHTVFKVALCYDDDVFTLNRMSRSRMKMVEKSLKAAGVKQVVHVKAELTIEDWFLLDWKGILNYLEITDNSKSSNYKHLEGLKKIFRKGKKTYIKGKATNEFIDALDLKVIADKIEQDIPGLYDILGVSNRKRGK